MYPHTNPARAGPGAWGGQGGGHLVSKFFCGKKQLDFLPFLLLDPLGFISCDNSVFEQKNRRFF
jgi:hypothetical protein